MLLWFSACPCSPKSFCPPSLLLAANPAYGAQRPASSPGTTEVAFYLGASMVSPWSKL